MKVIYVDIDETICHRETSTDFGVTHDYTKAEPIQENIDKINKLYDEGNTIVYWTARGCVTGQDYYEMTKDQLLKWGAKYHELQVGNKPFFDFYICDKSFNSESFFHAHERGLP